MIRTENLLKTFTTKSGPVTAVDGLTLQGYLVNSNGNISNQLTDLRIANTILPPEVGM